MKYKSFLSLSVLFLLFPCLALRAELDPPGGTVLFAFDDIWPFLGPSGEAPVISAPIASAGRPVTISVNAADLGQWSQLKVTMLDEQFHELPGYTAKECTGPEQAGLHQRGTWGKNNHVSAGGSVRVRINFSGVRPEDLLWYAVYVEPAK